MMTSTEFEAYAASYVDFTVKYFIRLKAMKTFQLMLADVAAFLAAGGQPAPTKTPTFETRELRYRLLAEELAEFRSAENRIAELDALIDQLYVLCGTIVAYDYVDVVAVAWERVHKANMAKFADGVKRRPDGKILKPAGWMPPDLSDLV